MPDGHGSLDSCFRRNDRPSQDYNPEPSSGFDPERTLNTRHLHSSLTLTQPTILRNSGSSITTMPRDRALSSFDPASSPASTKSVF